MKKIKNIIVSTDFSVTSRQAYRYAKALANELNASLTIIHVKESLVMVSDDMNTPFAIEDERELVKDIEILMKEENLSDRNKTGNQHVSINVFEGDVVDILTQLSKNGKTDLIVMGTTGLSDVLDKIFGSTSIKVSNKAHCPVILVPRDAKWQPIKHIMFASNFDSITPIVIDKITDFALDFAADIDFLNVKNFDPPVEAKQKEIDWDKLIINNKNLSFLKHTIYGNDTVKQLKKYSEDKDIDLIAFASKHRNFWQNLIHKSITENLALSATIPIMVIHNDDPEN
jgi:nucleotide-binding universal stress UspA family protein